jgi:pectate lyase
MYIVIRKGRAMKTLTLNFRLICYMVCAVLLSCTSSTAIAEMDNDVPTGVAALPSGTFKEEWSTNKVEGCIGGGNGEVVTATTARELSEFLKGDKPMYIQIDGARSRNPRAGIGKIHIINSYYLGVGYGLHTYFEAQATVEKCYFKDTNDAISQHKPGNSGTKHTSNGFNHNWDGHVWTFRTENQ